MCAEVEGESGEDEGGFEFFLVLGLDEFEVSLFEFEFIADYVGFGVVQIACIFYGLCERGSTFLMMSCMSLR